MTQLSRKERLKPVFDLYKAILSLSSMVSDDDGYISVTLAGAQKPCMLQGCRLLMPYDERINEFDTNSHRIFHPLMEGLSRGESKVVEKLRLTFIAKTNFVIGKIGLGLLNILNTPELHTKLDPEQSKLFETIKDNFPGSHTKWMDNTITRISKNKSPDFINMRLIKRGTYRGRAYPRLGVVFFPFYEALCNRTPEELNLRVKEVTLYKQLLNFMFGNLLDDKEAFCRPSDSDVAPFLAAFVKTAACIAENLNYLSDTFKDYIYADDADYKANYFETEGIDQIDNLVTLVPVMRSIPAQIGNDGEIERVDPPAAAVPPVTQTPVAQPQAQGGFPATPVTPLGQPMAPAAAPALGIWDSVPLPLLPQQNPLIAQLNATHAASAAAFNRTPAWAVPNTAPNFNSYPQQQPQVDLWGGLGIPQANPFGMNRSPF